MTNKHGRVEMAAAAEVAGESTLYANSNLDRV